MYTLRMNLIDSCKIKEMDKGNVRRACCIKEKLYMGSSGTILGKKPSGHMK